VLVPLVLVVVVVLVLLLLLIPPLLLLLLLPRWRRWRRRQQRATPARTDMQVVAASRVSPLLKQPPLEYSTTACPTGS
jgi:Flp pilus assembly protein TadB